MFLLYEYKKKFVKFILVIYIQALVCQKLDFRAFSPALRGSGGEQLLLILETKSERPLTHLPVVKV
jgi:hypothetical protein